MSKIQQEMTTWRQKDASILRTQLQQTQQELQKARVDLAFGRSAKPSVIQVLRRRAARLKTLIRAKEIINV